MSDSNLQVVREGGSIVVHGADLEATEEAAWVGRQLDDRRILVLAHEPGMPAAPHGMASCSIEVFKDFFLGLHLAGWTGLVAIDTGYGIKKAYLSRGAIVFAGSNVIDDRLGEVIYREARITLDELTDSAAQVTKQRKFGQVLVASGIFTNVELWQALKLQVKQILRSIFMVDRVYFELQEGAALAPTEVVFTEAVSDLVSECYSFGCAFRVFLGKLRVDSEVAMLVPKEKLVGAYAPGTFVGDLIGLIEAQSSVQSLLDSSKLIDTYTVAALFLLVNQGICKVLPGVEEGRRTIPLVAPLKAKIDAYEYVLAAVRRVFVDSSKEFPASDVEAFAAGLNPEGFPSLFLDPQANLGRDCVSGMLSQCAANPERVNYFIIRIESMIQFLLQVAGDNLAFPKANAIRQEYRALTA